MKKEIATFFLIAFLIGVTVFAAEKLEKEEEERPEYCEIREKRPGKIQQAFEEGKLTERQKEILLVREEFRGINRSEGIQIEILNERGFDVTDEEMRQLRRLTVELGLTGYK